MPLLTSTQLTKNSLLSEFSRNTLLSQGFTSPAQALSQKADKKFHVNAKSNLIKSVCSLYLDLGTQSLRQLHKHSETYQIHPALAGVCAAVAGTELTLSTAAGRGCVWDARDTGMFWLQHLQSQGLFCPSPRCEQLSPGDTRDTADHMALHSVDEAEVRSKGAPLVLGHFVFPSHRYV